MSSAAGPTRRAVLLTGPSALLAVACTGDATQPVPPAPPAVDPDDALRRRAAERERALLREYDAVLRALPELAARLTPVRAHHESHLIALLGPAPTPTGPTPAGSASPAAAPAVPAPADATAALARLVAAERAAGDAHGRDCLGASRALAGVLAALSASELSHRVALA